jgi:nicotinamide riboside kinase
MRNIYVIGAQSTGKTTLVNALKTTFEDDASRDPKTCPPQPLIISEVARSVLREKRFSRQDLTTSPIRALRLQQYVLKAQYDAEITTDPSNTTAWYICDRSGIDPIVYARCFAGAEAAAGLLASKPFLELETRMKNGIVFLCEAGSQWLVDDGVRLMPNDMEEWTYVDRTFRGLLEWRGISYFVVPKYMTDLTKRVEYVRKLIDSTSENALD